MESIKQKAEEQEKKIFVAIDNLSEVVMEDEEIKALISQMELEMEGIKVCRNMGSEYSPGQKLHIRFPQISSYSFVERIFNKDGIKEEKRREAKRISAVISYFGQNPTEYVYDGMYRISMDIVAIHSGGKSGKISEKIQKKYASDIQVIKDIFREVLCPFTDICPDKCFSGQEDTIFPKGSYFRINKCEYIKTRYLLLPNGEGRELRECWEQK